MICCRKVYFWSKRALLLGGAVMTCWCALSLQTEPQFFDHGISASNIQLQAQIPSDPVSAALLAG